MQGPIARGTVRTSFVLGLRLVVQACTLLIVARMLGPHQFGAFAGVAALAVMLGTLSTFGTHLVLLGEVSREPSRRAQVFPYAVPTTLLFGGVLLAIYLLTCTLVLREADVSLGVLVAIGAAELWLQPLFGLPAAEHLGLGRIARSQLLTALPLALRLLTAIAVLLSHPANPLTAYACGYLLASVVALATATATMSAPWPHIASWRLPTKTELRGAAGYAAINVTAATPTEIDKTLATKFLPLATAGVYAAGARVISAVTLPVIAMMLASLPRLFREGNNQSKLTRRLLRWIFSAAFAYSIVLAVMLWLIAPIFSFLFGTKYEGIQHMIQWLCLAIPGMALRMAAGNVLMGLGKPWMRAAFELVGLVTLLVAVVILTQRCGMIGMPLALACSEWTMAMAGGLCIWLSQRHQATLATSDRR
ncbi:MAG TPA: oligosaccharide flippase family protein [Rhodanobacteraceae bacterium]|nr:oligosaccharide flippase family protein [Rhodanobacteraceae bacterium]